MKISLYLNEKIDLTVSKQRCVCAKVGMLEVFGETYQKHLKTWINLDISSPTHLGWGFVGGEEVLHLELLEFEKVYQVVLMCLLIPSF